jgi:hypothetical protein
MNLDDVHDRPIAHHFLFQVREKRTIANGWVGAWPSREYFRVVGGMKVKNLIGNTKEDEKNHAP